MPPTLGKANVGFVVPVVVAGVFWLVGNRNVGAGVAVGLEVVVVGGAGTVGFEKKLGTAGLVAGVGGSGFVGGVGRVVAVGLAKRLETAGWARVGTVAGGVGNKLLVGSFVSVAAVVTVAGFGCVEAAEAGVGVNKLGVVVAEVVVASLGGITRAGEGFFSTSDPF